MQLRVLCAHLLLRVWQTACCWKGGHHWSSVWQFEIRGCELRERNQEPSCFYQAAAAAKSLQSCPRRAKLCSVGIHLVQIKWTKTVSGMNPPAKEGDIRDVGLIPGSGRSPAAGHGNPLQYSCLGNHVDRGAWQTTYSPLGSHRVRHGWRDPATQHTHTQEAQCRTL